MKRHINSFLIAAIAIAFIILGVISYYYQGTFKDVITNYQSTKTTLKSCTNELLQLKSRYTSAAATINTSKQDIAKFGQLYEETQTDLEKTKGKLKSTEGALSQTQRSLEETKGLYETEKIRTTNLEEQLRKALDAVNDLEKKNDALRRDNAKLSADLATCRAS